MISYLVYSLMKIIPSLLPQTMLHLHLLLYSLRSRTQTCQVMEYLRRSTSTSLPSHLEDRDSRIYSSHSTSMWDQSPEVKLRN
jgi:hypothetical protein